MSDAPTVERMSATYYVLGRKPQPWGGVLRDPRTGAWRSFTAHWTSIDRASLWDALCDLVSEVNNTRSDQ